MRLRDELIQVAAVAVAIVEDLDHGSTGPDHTEMALNSVWNERVAQDVKWGPQHHDPREWLAILMEELGEAADELTHTPDAVDQRERVLNHLLLRMQQLGHLCKLNLDEVLFP